MSRSDRRRVIVATALLAALAACATVPAADPATDTASTRAVADSLPTADAIPAGKGTLRTDDIALRLQVPGIQVRMIPLNEDIIRVLSPDSYRAMRDLVESRRADLTRMAAQRGMRGESVWYVTFHGVETEARFTPTDLTVTSMGRDYRPIEIIPLSQGFGNQRVRQRETLSALYLFEDGINVEQALTVSMDVSRNTSWEAILRRIQRERALIRGRG